MLRLSVPLRALVLSTLYLSTTPLAGSILPDAPLDRRQEVDDERLCGVAGFQSCNASGLPKNFCCPTGHSCLVGAFNTTVVCCPDGQECNAIRPIFCDLSSQDISKSPDSLIKTILSTGELPKCGNGCCAWGYSCGEDADGEPACFRDEDQDVIPTGAALPSASSPSSEVPSITINPTTTAEATDSTSTSTSTATSPPAAGEEGEEEGEEKKNATFPIILGVVGGTVALAAIIVILIFVMRNRRRVKAQTEVDRRHKRVSSSSFGNIISEPIVSSETLRSDFGRAQEAPSSRVTSAGSGAVRPMGQTRQQNPINIDEYWRNDIAKSNGGGARLVGSKVGVPTVKTVSGRTATPQMGEMLRATTSHSSDSDPFQDNHAYIEDDDHKRGGSSGSGRRRSIITPIRGMAGSRNQRPNTPPAMAIKSGAMGKNSFGGGKMAGGVGNSPMTPPNRQRPREPSGADIDVFADPATLADSPGLADDRQSRGTTFGGLMEAANLGDVARGGAYVPKSAYGARRRDDRG